jgi:hypothetical protein
VQSDGRILASVLVSMGAVACGGTDTPRAAAPAPINVAGVITDFLTRRPVSEPLAVGAVDSMVAATGLITVLGSATGTGTGAFLLEQVDVASQQGLILLVDDAPAGGPYTYSGDEAALGGYFPMISGVADYSSFSGTASPKQDLAGVVAFALPSAVVEQWQSLAGLGEVKNTGFALGIVLDEATGHPLANATVASTYPYRVLSVAYVPDGLSPATVTGASGIFLTNDAGLMHPTLAKAGNGELSIKATVPGYACDAGIAVVLPKVAFLVAISCRQE